MLAAACAVGIASTYESPVGGTVTCFTMPIPVGIMTPIFLTGAAFGRMFGEIVRKIFPHGIRRNQQMDLYLPASYAIIGAGAFSGAVTHAVSVSVVVIEMTGQITYILPMMLSVIIAVAVCEGAQPSLYSSIIDLCGLPRLKTKERSAHKFHDIHVSDIMMKDCHCICQDSTYREMQDLVISEAKIRSFPLVLDKGSMILIGSVKRCELIAMLDNNFGDIPRRAEAERRLARATIRNDNETDIEPVSSSTRFKISHVEASEEAHPASSNASAIREEGKTKKSYEDDPEIWTLRKLINVDKYLDATHMWPNSTFISKFVKDVSEKKRKRWEEAQLDLQIDWSDSIVDPAPFKLMEGINVLKASSIFYKLGIKRAFVTHLGRLIGILTMQQVQNALEDIGNKDHLESTGKKHEGSGGFTQRQFITVREPKNINPYLPRARQGRAGQGNAFMCDRTFSGRGRSCSKRGGAKAILANGCCPFGFATDAPAGRDSAAGFFCSCRRGDGLAQFRVHSSSAQLPPLEEHHCVRTVDARSP
ncbi:unnamed protein product [Soboliphyme baturini]|uniref:Chloride channel protein n=1 Tax=Soboliphyme baturini TaxID=241478 RepID=A0A183IIG6_9BILA|nr:unnamed protein product [Soboliphyme baturini]